MGRGQHNLDWQLSKKNDTPLADNNSLSNVLATIKKEFENSIETNRFNNKKYKNGSEAVQGYIRSQKLINHIHNYFKIDLINNDVESSKIFPPLGHTKPEICLEGALKTKQQDIVVLPENIKPNLKNRLSENDSEIEKVISINIRSQMSSVNKNFDTLFERTYAEAVNLHNRFPRMCLGEIFMIPAYEYNQNSIKNNLITFTKSNSIYKYIEHFNKLNNRIETNNNEYKYESLALLIVDFNRADPKAFTNSEELYENGLITQEQSKQIKLEDMSYEIFTKRLLDIYKTRFIY